MSDKVKVVKRGIVGHFEVLFVEGDYANGKGYTAYISDQEPHKTIEDAEQASENFIALMDLTQDIEKVVMDQYHKQTEKDWQWLTDQHK